MNSGENAKNCPLTSTGSWPWPLPTFLALEGITDTISLPEAVRQCILGARPAYALYGAQDRLGVHYANHGHAFTTEDWTALLDFFDKHLRGLSVSTSFDRFPTETELDQAAERAKALEAPPRAHLPQDKLLHSLAVEAIMREFAAPPTDNRHHWALAGLLHDIDLPETAQDLTRHGLLAAQLLQTLGFPPPVIQAVKSHDDRPGIPDRRLDHALYCADQLYWLNTGPASPPLPSTQHRSTPKPSGKRPKPSPPNNPNSPNSPKNAPKSAKPSLKPSPPPNPPPKTYPRSPAETKLRPPPLPSAPKD